MFRERLAWAGPWSESERDWHFGRAEAAASLFVSGPVPFEILPELPGDEVAVQATAAGDTCVRLLGTDGEQVIAAAARLAFAAAAHLAGESRPWFADSHLLTSTNHWFSQPPVADDRPGPPGRPEALSRGG